MRNSQKVQLIIGAILVLGGIAAGSFFIWRDLKKDQDSSPPALRRASPAVSPIVPTSTPVQTQSKSLRVPPPPDLSRPFIVAAKLSREEKSKTLAKIDNVVKSLRSNPDNRYGWLELGILRKYIGDYEGARQAWEYLTLIRPDDFVPFYNLGDLYWHQFSDYPQAEKNLRVAIQKEPDVPVIYTALADLYYYRIKEKAHLADDVLLEGIEANPKDVNLVKDLAYHYERIEDYPKAIEWWQRVLEKEPNNSEVAAAIESLKKRLITP